MNKLLSTAIILGISCNPNILLSQECEPAVYTLWGGQHINVGTVMVFNDDETLYVQYDTMDGWLLTSAHLYVMESEPNSRLIPGRAPHKSGNITQTNTYTFEVPLGEDLNFCDEDVSLWLQAKADVVKINSSGRLQGESAYGGTIDRPRRGAWYGNIEYLLCCDDGDTEVIEAFSWVLDECWSEGKRYVEQGSNWASYTEYDPGKKVTLFAKETLEAGTVEFSEVTVNPGAMDTIDITIHLNKEWRFAERFDDDGIETPDTFNIRVQGYSEPPVGEPDPTKFSLGAGITSGGLENTPMRLVTLMSVPVNNYYGIRVYVQEKVSIE